MENINTNVYKAAVYLRLSKEDGDVADGNKLVSNSISNQKSLIMDFLKSHTDIQLHTVYSDDGYSGVNFERPEFQRMLDDIRKGVVNCVIVKDLSRFGRNYIEAGRYIEKIFPMLGVRFIAINDNYDSKTSLGVFGSDIVVPFKNLINDAYCRDISIKIRSNLQIKRKRGDFIGAFAVYGYVKDERNKNRLVIDEYAAGVVRDIFAMKISGLSQHAIAERLNNGGVLSPIEYKKSIGVNLETPFKKNPQSKWSYTAVYRILKNIIYTGTLAQGKNTTPNYKIKTRIMKPESEWIKVENTHEPIISLNDFNLIQELLKQDTRISPKQDTLFPLAGVLYCGDCKEPMVRKVVPTADKKYIYYVCSGNKNDKTFCSAHRINEARLTESLLYLLQNHIKNVLSLEAALKIIEKAPKLKADAAKFDTRITKKRAELENAEKRKLNLYEDFKDGVLSKKEYLQLKAEYDRRITDAEKDIFSYEREMQLILENKSVMHEWINNFKKYQNIHTLERNAVVMMIKRIDVLSADKIEILFNFEDEFKRCSEYVANCKYAARKESI